MQNSYIYGRPKKLSTAIMLTETVIMKIDMGR